jgi:hypothetical protein
MEFVMEVVRAIPLDGIASVSGVAEMAPAS